MRKLIWPIRKVHADLTIAGIGFALAVVGLLYFNWLIAVSRQN